MSPQHDIKKTFMTNCMAIKANESKTIRKNVSFACYSRCECNAKEGKNHLFVCLFFLLNNKKFI